MPKQDFEPRFGLLREVAQDLRYLLDRGYRKEPALRFLGNRWSLREVEREILKRGVFSEEEAQKRAAKKIGPQEVQGKILFIDGHNVLVTVESGLLGYPVFEADDGFVRDARKLSRRFQPRESSLEALKQITRVLKELKVQAAVFFLDRPLSRSGELAGTLRNFLLKFEIPGEVKLVKAADEALKEKALVATADAYLIENVSHVFDLAGYVLQKLKIKPFSLRKSVLSPDDFPHLEDGKIKRDDDPSDHPA